MREWNCQLNIYSRRWLCCRNFLFLLDHMGKPEKSCIGSGSDTSVQQVWLHEAERPCVSALVSTVHLSTVCSHTASTETLLHAALRDPSLWWSSACAHTQLLLCVWETNRPWWFLFLPPVQCKLLQKLNRGHQMP